jgi:hypothetical protein
MNEAEIKIARTIKNLALSKAMMNAMHWLAESMEPGGGRNDTRYQKQ